MPMLPKLSALLNAQKVAYETIHHRRDFTAQETAADTHTPGRAFAKTVILAVDGKYHMFVLPATHMIDLAKVKQELRAKDVRLTTEDEIAGICADCEVGAMPPFGSLYDMPTHISHVLANDQLITFNAGTHEDVVRMLYSDYAKMAKPEVMNFTLH